MMHRLFACLTPALLMVSVEGNAHAEPTSPEGDGAVRAETTTEVMHELREIRRELNELKELLFFVRQTMAAVQEREGPVHPVHFQSSMASLDDYAIGAPNAPLVMHMFIDFRCAFCALFSRTVLPQLRQRYVEPGTLRIVFRDFPDENDPHSVVATSFAACAGAQGKYEDAYDLLFERPDLVVGGEIDALAKQLPGLDLEKFQRCAADPHLAPQRQQGKLMMSPEAALDVREAELLGVIGTPSFFLAPRFVPGEAASGLLVKGSQEFAMFESIIDQLLKTNK